MSAVLPKQPAPTLIHGVGRIAIEGVIAVGDLTGFVAKLISQLPRMPRGKVLWPIMHDVGVQSLPVILVTGLFIGMVLAVQTFDTLRLMHVESRLGSVVNVSLVKELGPVLAATMLAGRIGSRIAAEIGTMRVTEQIDALQALGADPIGYLVVPRFLACFLLIPVLTILADGIGMLGGWAVSVYALGVSDHYYWLYSDSFVTAFDCSSGVAKSLTFGAAIAVVACHRGFHCGAGAEGVGRAATEAFVYSFIAILVLDFILGVAFLQLYRILYGGFMLF
ncbi:MAG TPA: ABC transporter permease [Planctomycetaceae bacterium]|jgi:phospholipid/cholesterol/gamma-HCH transport system permease protein|nr:ABC transporter permease [Planctomycetaceae bacterium]